MRRKLSVHLVCLSALAPALVFLVTLPSMARSPGEHAGGTAELHPAASPGPLVPSPAHPQADQGQARGAKPEGTPAQPGDYAGSEACAACHEEATASYRRSAHHLAWRNGQPDAGCESCHGPGQRHVESGGDRQFIFSFDPADHTVRDLSEACLRCHGRNEQNFRAHSGEHMAGGIACSSCHKPHQASTRKAMLQQAGHQACLSCHKEVLAEINMNERHRIKEGVVRCVDCHDPHGPNQRARLGPFNNERVCARCHADKTGPFVFEHPAVRVEGCLSCHRPHGGVNRHMLLYQSTAKLCYSCHTVVPAFHSRFDATTNCVNCHSAIHGSNLDPYFLR